MSSGFCCAGNKILQFVICRAKLHAVWLSASKSLYVKTEFYQKSRPHFLRFFALTFDNPPRPRRARTAAAGKRNRVFKELSTFPTDFSTSIFSLYFNAYPEKKPENVNPANGIFLVFNFCYAVSITDRSMRYAGKNARYCKTGGEKPLPNVRFPSDTGSARPLEIQKFPAIRNGVMAGAIA